MILLAGKEMTFAVIEDFPRIQALYVIPLIGVLNNMLDRNNKLLSIKWKNLYGTVCLTVMSAVAIASIVWEKFEEKTPDFIRRGYEYGVEYIRFGNDSDLYNALHNLDKALSLNSSDNTQRYNIAMLYMQSGSFGRSSEILDSLIKKCPNNALYMTGKARLEIIQGDTLAGARKYAKAIILDPRITDDKQWEKMKNDSPKFYKDIEAEVFKLAADGAYLQDPIKSAKFGKLMLEFGCCNEAESCLRNALKMLPNLGKGWYNLGVALFQQQEYAEAEQCFRKAGFLLSGNLFIKEFLCTKGPDKPEEKKRIR